MDSIIGRIRFDWDPPGLQYIGIFFKKALRNIDMKYLQTNWLTKSWKLKRLNKGFDKNILIGSAGRGIGVKNQTRKLNKSTLNVHVLNISSVPWQDKRTKEV